jgi:acylpyruvate hydrolase
LATEQGLNLLPGSIWCVGRNFADHAKELGNAVPTAPMIFLKAGSCIVPAQTPLRLPSFSGDIHYEVELAVELGADLQPARAAVSLDLTARDVQVRCN